MEFALRYVMLVKAESSVKPETHFADCSAAVSARSPSPHPSLPDVSGPQA